MMRLEKQNKNSLSKLAYVQLFILNESNPIFQWIDVVYYLIVVKRLPMPNPSPKPNPNTSFTYDNPYSAKSTMHAGWRVGEQGKSLWSEVVGDTLYLDIWNDPLYKHGRVGLKLSTITF